MGHVELSAKNCTSDDDVEALMGEEDGSMGENSTRGKIGIGRRLVMAFKILFYISIFAAEVYVLTGLGPIDSTIYIQDVYIPALALHTNTNTNTTSSINGTTPFNASIIVDLKFQRRAARSFNVFTKDYTESGLVVFYSHSLTPAANYRFRAFHMGRNMMVHDMAAAMEAPELPWEEALRTVSGGSTVELVVEFGGAHSVSSDYALAAHVAVDASGHMVSKGPIKLS